MVLAHVGGKLRHLVPMLHQGVFGSYFLMSVGDVLIDECQGLLPAVELDAAVQIARQARQSLYPAVETRFKFCPRWYRHLYSADGIERLLDACHDDLTAQTIEETLVELSPELRRNRKGDAYHLVSAQPSLRYRPAGGTTGEAVALKLVPDAENWHADGKDLMHVRIYAVDKKGRRVLNVKDAKAFDKLTFQVKGDANIVAVDNGNISSDELHIGKTQLEKTIQRNLFQGSALVILRAGKQNRKVELMVSSDKMKARKLVLNTK